MPPCWQPVWRSLAVPPPLNRPGAATLPGPKPPRRLWTADFVASSVSGITSVLERAVFDQEMASRPGFLQGADPRAKVVAALAILVATGLSRSLAVVILVSLVMVLLAALSRLSVGAFLRRAWLGIPGFAAVVAAPALFMLSGRTILVVVDTPPAFLAISDNSLYSFALLVGRVGASVSIAVLLVSTTRWAELLRALAVLRVPESMVVVLGMTYRYLFLFLHMANNLFLARASRTVGYSSGAEERRWAAGAAGTLMSRSVRMSGDILLAMRARGFSGEVRTAPDPRMGDGDWLLVALAAASAAGLLLLAGWLP